jgi:hypothetical protein
MLNVREGKRVHRKWWDWVHGSGLGTISGQPPAVSCQRGAFRTGEMGTDFSRTITRCSTPSHAHPMWNHIPRCPGLPLTTNSLPLAPLRSVPALFGLQRLDQDTGSLFS